jgi:hypothetical protein
MGCCNARSAQRIEINGNILIFTSRFEGNSVLNLLPQGNGCRANTVGPV